MIRQFLQYLTAFGLIKPWQIAAMLIVIFLISTLALWILSEELSK